MTDPIRLTPVYDHEEHAILDRARIVSMTRWHHTDPSHPDPQTTIELDSRGTILVRETPEEILAAPTWTKQP